jgi:hypothetical protein
MSVQFVLDNLTIQCIAVDTKDLGRLGLISTGFGEGVLNESLFELIHSFIQINPAFDHLGNKGFQLLFHNVFLTLQVAGFPSPVDVGFYLFLPPPALQRAVTD